MALDQTQTTYGIAELAREFGITPRAIRFYEDKGLLSPARDGQRRIYGSRDHVRLRLIMRGKRLGFSLDEIREMIDLYDLDPTEVSQLKMFIDKLQARREQLRRQQDDIIETLAELDQLEDQSRGLLADREARRKAVG
ncbi:MAG TPA: MerR family transcriptional regulator [Rhodospirillaceae bacterium]|nr:MerR family transcriptional regulator [Rhodospirillaceae bacterium]|tara:strand:+ start:1667 stop:2080 length:414 start_codon:yes stop_codon:yes gene_type:complete